MCYCVVKDIGLFMKKLLQNKDVKNFAISSLFFLSAGIVMSISNSFDREYIAKLEQDKSVKQAIAEAEQDGDVEEKEGVAMNKR